MAKLNVLIVDDEKHFQDLICDWVNSWGHTTTVASSGQEAIEAIKNNEFDLVILDYQMPVMNGITTLEEIRKINSKIAVIMLTGYPDEKSFVEGSKLGISFYVTKFDEVVSVHNVFETAFDMVKKNLEECNSSGQ